jgi:DNA-binding IclR family transcriptional regulator
MRQYPTKLNSLMIIKQALKPDEILSVAEISIATGINKKAVRGYLESLEVLEVVERTTYPREKWTGNIHQSIFGYKLRNRGTLA